MTSGTQLDADGIGFYRLDRPPHILYAFLGDVGGANQIDVFLADRQVMRAVRRWLRTRPSIKITSLERRLGGIEWLEQHQQQRAEGAEFHTEIPF